MSVIDKVPRFDDVPTNALVNRKVKTLDETLEYPTINNFTIFPVDVSNGTIDRFVDEFFFLSNFYICDIEITEYATGEPDGPVVFRNYKSVEHAYQAMKTDDINLRRSIASAKSPGDAKRLGRKLKLKYNWEFEKNDVMMSLLIIKFTNIDNDLLNKLIATRGFNLVEGNTWNDTYWGMYNGSGKNILGKMLMFLRDVVFYHNRELNERSNTTLK